MELSRRDALAALSAAGVGGLAGCGGESGESSPSPSDAPDERVTRTLVGAAEVLYPGEAEDPGEFVRTYVAGRIADRPEYREGVVATALELDDLARDWRDAPFAALDPSVRDRILRDLSVDTADADPGGDLSSRIRYYVVDELLFAFYASPAGGGLVGIENPVGYPGGTQSYRQPPPEQFREGEAGSSAASSAGDDGGDDG